MHRLAALLFGSLSYVLAYGAAEKSQACSRKRPRKHRVGEVVSISLSAGTRGDEKEVMKLRIKSVMAVLGLCLTGVVGGPVGSASAVESQCSVIGSPVGFYSDIAPVGYVKIGSLDQEWCPNGIGGGEPKRVAVATWTWSGAQYLSGYTSEDGSVWLENGPHTRTLSSLDAFPEADFTVQYPIDYLAYPKTVDAAIHLRYRVFDGASSRSCDLWVAGVSHDYSTGTNRGGAPSQFC